LAPFAAAVPFVAFVAATLAVDALAQPGPPPGPAGVPAPPPPVIEDLGGERYRIGPIELDRKAGRFIVAGRVLELAPADAPLEFLAVARDGFKSYESALMLDADAYQFNLACILIGLKENPGSAPQVHFDPRPVEGDPVRLSVAWTADGKTVSRPASTLLRTEAGAPAPSEAWVYTGSHTLPDGGFAAHVVGTVIGFVHDPDSIIHHRDGLGLGAYGAVTYNRDAGPEPGTVVTLTVAKGGG
jgi:hypothetical protein